MTLVAGIDCSTQSTKVVVIDSEDGRLVASGRQTNPVHRNGPASETDPEEWWRLLADALAQTGLAGEIGAISIAAQQLGLVTLDAAKRPMRRAILWDDTRSADAAERLVSQLGGRDAWAHSVGTQPVAGLTACSWAWLRGAEPEVARRVAHIRLPHDFLTERLTGSGVTDRGDASGTGWWSSRLDAYVAEVLALPDISVDEAMLPRVLPHDACAGEVLASAAAHTGLRAGIPVGCGTGDNMAAALALGVGPGLPVISLGTSGTAFVRSSTPPADASGQVFADASASGDHLPLTCTLNATLAVDNLARLLGIASDAVAPATRQVVMPYLSGERLPNYPHARGTMAGIDHDTTAGELLLAAYEGVVYSLVSSLDVLARHSSGLDADAPLILVGGGARGAVWQQTVARLSGRRVIVPDCDELVAWGAAAQAAATLTDETPDDVARRWQIARGTELEAVPRDEAAIERIVRVRDATHALNGRAMF